MGTRKKGFCNLFPHVTQKNGMPFPLFFRTRPTLSSTGGRHSVVGYFLALTPTFPPHWRACSDFYGLGVTAWEASASAGKGGCTSGQTAAILRRGAGIAAPHTPVRQLLPPTAPLGIRCPLPGGRPPYHTTGRSTGSTDVLNAPPPPTPRAEQSGGG